MVAKSSDDGMANSVRNESTKGSQVKSRAWLYSQALYFCLMMVQVNIGFSLIFKPYLEFCLSDDNC
jgi:hypothetical protein